MPSRRGLRQPPEGLLPADAARFSRRLTPSGDGFAYVGAGHVADEPPRAYGASADQDEVGCLTALGADRLLLELPRPRLESYHNLLEMVRRR